MTSTEALGATRSTVLRATIIGFDPRAAELYERFDEFNAAYFGSSLEDLPLLVVQVFPYGRCIGRMIGRTATPIIEIGQRQMAEGPEDVLIHEMLHAYLYTRGEDPSHNGKPWCREIERISPLYLGLEVRATPQIVKRIDGKPTRWTPEGHLTRRQLASWPHSLLASVARDETARSGKRT